MRQNRNIDALPPAVPKAASETPTTRKGAAKENGSLKTALKRVHLYSDLNGTRTRCGAGTLETSTTNSKLVTCPLCQYWEHRGLTTPRRKQTRENLQNSRKKSRLRTKQG